MCHCLLSQPPNTSNGLRSDRGRNCTPAREPYTRIAVQPSGNAGRQFVSAPMLCAGIGLPKSLLRLGSNAKTMRETVIVRNKELGLSVFSLRDFRDRVPEPLQSVPQLLQVGWGPVQPNAFVVFGFDRCSCTLVKPEIQMPPVVNHASDQLPFASHFPVHRKTEALDPKAQTLLEIGAGDHRHIFAFERLPLIKPNTRTPSRQKDPTPASGTTRPS